MREVGYGSATQPLPAASAHAANNRVDYDYGSVDEWFVNGPWGLQQGFTLAERPSQEPLAAATEASEPLTVVLGLGGSLHAAVNADGDGLTLTRPDGIAALSYAGLTAYDAAGRVLPASFEVRQEFGRSDLLICVVDAGAEYPLTIDPLVQESKLTSSDGEEGDYLGASVAISGDTVVVGAPCGPCSFSENINGGAYVFVKPTSGWSSMTTETAKLTASDGAAGDGFGGSVAISGDTVVVGAPNATTVGGEGGIVMPGPGAAYVFVKPPSGWSNMTETARLLPTDERWDGDAFGTAVAISGETVVVGAPNAPWTAEGMGPGAAYVFVEPEFGWSDVVTQTAELWRPPSADRIATGLAPRSRLAATRWWWVRRDPRPGATEGRGTASAPVRPMCS